MHDSTFKHDARPCQTRLSNSNTFVCPHFLPTLSLCLLIASRYRQAPAATSSFIFVQHIKRVHSLTHLPLSISDYKTNSHRSFPLPSSQQHILQTPSTKKQKTFNSPTTKNNNKPCLQVTPPPHHQPPSSHHRGRNTALRRTHRRTVRCRPRRYDLPRRRRSRGHQSLLLRGAPDARTGGVGVRPLLLRGLD